MYLICFFSNVLLANEQKWYYFQFGKQFYFPCRSALTIFLKDYALKPRVYRFLERGLEQ